jgi:hypothetical protein
VPGSSLRKLLPDEAMNCPECAQPPTLVGQHLIGPEHGLVAPGRLMASSLRIFLRYGHDPNEKSVRRLRADLDKFGHGVWFDGREFKFGDGWQRPDLSFREQARGEAAGERQPHTNPPGFHQPDLQTAGCATDNCQ